MEERKCSMCGESEENVQKLIKGADGYVCNGCTGDIVGILAEPTGLHTDTIAKFTVPELVKLIKCNFQPDGKQKEQHSLGNDSLDYNVIKPKVIYDHLDKFVVDQKKAKRVLSIAAHTHLKRIKHPVVDGVKIGKSNVLFVGPTGSGKTLLAETLAAFLGLPMVLEDCNEFTAAGYVGSDCENILQRLLKKADGDVEKAQRGIVFLDEIDKIGRKSENPSITRDVSGEDVQNALLKIIEGHTVYVSEGKRKHPGNEMTPIDTSNILFICSGAFSGIEKIVEQRLHKGTSIGFGAEVEQDKIEFDYSLVEPKDLSKFGLTPEFIGRLPVIAPLHKLDKETLRKVLVEPENSILKQYKALMSIDGIKLEFSDAMIDELVDEAYERGTGARGLRSSVAEILEDIMFEIPDGNDGVVTIEPRDDSSKIAA